MADPKILGFSAVFALSMTGAYVASSGSSEANAQITPANEVIAETGLQTVKKVLVARRSLSSGTLTERGDFVWREQVVDDGDWITTDSGFSPQDFSGAVILTDYSAGDPIHYDHTVRPDQKGFLSAVLSPGKRAISVPVNDVTASAGLIGPGDYVDLLLTFYADSDRGARTMERGRDISMLTGKTLATAVRVIAINRQSIASPETETDTTLTTATLEVSPKQAQQLALATHMGELVLTLRSLQDEENTALNQEIWSSDVHSAGDQLKPDPGLVLMRGVTTQVVGYPQKDENTQQIQENQE